MFIIVDGEVMVHRREIQLKKLGTKHFFGEMSILDGEPRSASVTAISDCLMLQIDQSDFLQLLRTHNSIAVSMVQALNQRLRQALTTYEEANQK